LRRNIVKQSIEVALVIWVCVIAIFPFGNTLLDLGRLFSSLFVVRWFAHCVVIYGFAGILAKRSNSSSNFFSAFIFVSAVTPIPKGQPLGVIASHPPQRRSISTGLTI